ncbi:benzoate 4-monooxygenase cytochrome P450 [Fusarium heterosporum]|uniref:Benzoate 4-monooxygenase cytochrome P450 n=1 Tax=Fusarium heterosporum TaxID=42747 RepID=A0A8H5WWG2_FUSHE|nr:benzoate 4-monooxygenase cytochrome P450 [Fusarium heterosporum]
MNWHLRSPLRVFDGPFLARYTGLWWLYHACNGESHLVEKELHKKYGPYVLIAPNTIITDDIDLIKPMFKRGGGFQKSNFYRASYNTVYDEESKGWRKKLNLFSEIDAAKHQEIRRPISNLYSEGFIKTLEPQMDTVVELSVEKMRERSGSGKETGRSFDLGKHIKLFFWDTLGYITFSELPGYVKKGCDFDGSISLAERTMDDFVMRAVMPCLDPILNNRLFRLGPPGFDTMGKKAAQHVEKRSISNETIDDFLGKLIETGEDTTEIVSWMMINMIAGADTTSSIVISLFYFGLKNPSIWKRMTEEIRGADLLSGASCSYDKAKKLTYLEAVFREVLRHQPAVSMGLPRVVPPEGLIHKGYFFPGGIELSMNPFTTGRNRSVYGDDAEIFNPERWLRRDEEGIGQFKERRKRMDDADISFGSGRRKCIGEVMAHFLTLKIVVTLISCFDFNLANSSETLKVKNSFFIRQEGLVVNFCQRCE